MVLTDKEGLHVGWKVLVTGWALMECLMFGGIHYGWGSLNFILKSEGIYAELCPEICHGNASLCNATVVKATQIMKCKPQDSRMALCFTIASALYTVGCVTIGHVNYKCGMRVARIVAFLIFTSGSVMTAFISKENPWLMFPGLSCLAVGGFPLLVTNMQVSNLFSKGSSTVVGLLNGGVDSSAAMMLFVKIATENGVSRQNMFFLITGLHSLVVTVSTFFFLPRYFIKKRQSEFVPCELPETKSKQDKAGKEEVEKKLKMDLPSLRSCLCNPMYLTHVLWLCVLQLRFYYFIGSLNTYLGRVLNGDEDKDGKSDLYRNAAPAAVPLGMTSLLSVTMSILVLIPNPNFLYITFIVLTLKRSFLYSLAAAFIRDMFPEEYFAITYGIMMVTGGVFGLLQYALFTLAESYTGGALHVDICLLCLVSVSFLHPVHLWIASWGAERKLRAN